MFLQTLPTDIFIEILLNLSTNPENLSDLTNFCKAVPNQFQPTVKSNQLWKAVLLKHYNTFKLQIYGCEQSRTKLSPTFHLDLYKQFYRNILFNSTEFGELYSILSFDNRPVKFVENGYQQTWIPCPDVYYSRKPSSSPRTTQNFNLEVKLEQLSSISKSSYVYSVGRSQIYSRVPVQNGSIPISSVSCEKGPILNNILSNQNLEVVTFKFCISNRLVKFDKKVEPVDFIDSDSDEDCCMCGRCGELD